MTENASLIELTADIVVAFVSQYRIAAADMPGLIKATFAALANADTPALEPQEPQAPAVPIKKSIQPDHLICLEDGRKFKSLKRHLFTKYGLSPQDYRTKWGLPKDYPMVAPAYAEARSKLAKEAGLGRISKAPESSAPVVKSAARRGPGRPKATKAEASGE